MAVDLISQRTLSEDSVFGDFDCNDNTPILQPQTLHPCRKTQLDLSEMSATRCHAMSSFGSLSHSNGSDVSSASHQMAPDDALNNDFFYEDEFAVQFDMQLTAGDVDHDALLSVSQLYYGDGGATLWWSHLSGSKSENCLYELALDGSGSSGSSQELSLSDHNCSDTSEPLFTSPLRQDSGSSSVNTNHTHSDLSGSFRHDDGRYDYDWRANKDQYMLAFDQTPARQSDESSRDSDCLSATTSWAERAGSGSPRYMSWADRSGSSSSDPERVVPRTVLTSWKQLKEGSSSDEGDGETRGMTSWQEAGSSNRSRSLPELNNDGRSDPDRGTDTAQTASCWSAGDQDSSLSLFELFRKLRSQSDDDFIATDAMMSPDTLRRLTGTWSMSAGSLEARSSNAVSTPSDHVTSPEVAVGRLVDCDDGEDNTSHKTLTSWKTFTDVSGDVPGSTAGGTRVQLEDCSIQTSLEEQKVSTMDRALQTSFEVQHCPTPAKTCGDTVAPSPVAALGRSSASLQGFHSQLSSSVFETCAPLPDLSFLYPALSQSSTVEVVPLSARKRDHGSEGKGSAESVMQRLCRMTSVIGKLNDDSGHIQRTTIRSNESASTNSCCSSSSSGIDPGSFHESQNNSRTATYVNENACRFSAGSERAIDNDSCENCRRIKAILAPTTDDITGRDSKEMITSHPCYMRPSSVKRKGTLKRVDYLQVSPTHWPRSATYLLLGDSETCRRDGKLGMLVPVVGGTGAFKDGRLHCVRRRGRNHDAELQLMKRPLKSCLVKRRKRDRDRDKATALKHRSWSHPQDALILKYSHDGETQYELVTAGQRLFTSSPTDIQQTSLPADALQSHIDDGGQTEAVAMPPSEPGRCNETEAVATPLAVSKSSEAIPVPPCTCGTACAILHSSVESNDSSSSESGRRKKCVSFAEKVSYASPYCSPHPSPLKRACKMAAKPAEGREQQMCREQHVCGEQNVCREQRVCKEQHMCEEHHVCREQRVCKEQHMCEEHHVCREQRVCREQHVCQSSAPDDGREMPSWKTLNFQTAVHPQSPLRKSPSSDSDSSQESAPHEFMVSPPPPGGATACPAASSWESPDVCRKKELVRGLMKASERLLDYFSQTADISDKVTFCDSSHHHEVCHLVLSHVCPAVHAVMADGLRPRVRSLFGQVKNNVWKVVEQSTELGPSTRVLHDLVQELKGLQYLDTVSLKFNAFIFGLLNYQALDFWLGHVTSNEALVSKHYVPGSFLCLTSSQPMRHLALGMTAALQPLSQISFQLDYSFECRISCEGKRGEMSESLLHREATRTEEGKRETRQTSRDETAGRMETRTAHDDPRSASASWHQQLRRTVGEQWVERGQGAPLWRSTASHLMGRLHQSWHVDDLTHRVKKTFLSSSQVVTSVPQLVGINDTVDDLTHRVKKTFLLSSQVVTSVPQLAGINDMVDDVDTDGRRNDDTASLGGQRRLMAETVMRDNEVVSRGSTAEDAGEEREGGSWSEWGRQLLQELNPPRKVYKKGITEYAFDAEPVDSTAALLVGGRSPAVDVASNNVGSDDELEYLKKTVDNDQEIMKVTYGVPSDSTMSAVQPLDGSQHTDNGSESSSGSDTAPTSFTVPSSAGVVSMAESLSRSSTAALKVTVKKRLSGLGSSLINVFDRLLLDESKVRKVRRAPVKKAELVDQSDVVRVRDNAADHGGDTQTVGQSIDDLSETSGGQSVNHSNATRSDSTLRCVRALCYYIANDTEHLSFEKGSEMLVIGQVDHDWLLCRQGNSEGLVYAACVESVDDVLER